MNSTMPSSQDDKNVQLFESCIRVPSQKKTSDQEQCRRKIVILEHFHDQNKSTSLCEIPNQTKTNNKIEVNRENIDPCVVIEFSERKTTAHSSPTSITSDFPSPTSSDGASVSLVLKADQSSANVHTKIRRKRQNSALEEESTNKRQKKEIQSDHKCPACDKIYARRDTLHTHMEKVHRMSSRDIKQHKEKQRRLKHVQKMAEKGTPYSEEYMKIYLNQTI